MKIRRQQGCTSKHSPSKAPKAYGGEMVQPPREIWPPEEVVQWEKHRTQAFGGAQFWLPPSSATGEGVHTLALGGSQLVPGDSSAGEEFDGEEPSPSVGA
eukprot:RCo028542